jgi:hypothetical protein
MRLAFGTKRNTRADIELTDEEAKRLRDHLLGRYPLATTNKQPCDIASAAQAVEAARKEGKQ